MNPDGIENIVEIVGSILFGDTDTKPDPLNYIIVEQPAIVLAQSLTQAFRYNLSTNTLIPLNTETDIYNNIQNPPILATSDGKYAFSIYSNQIPANGFTDGPQKPFIGYNLNDQRKLWGIWSMSVRAPYYGKNSSIVSQDKLNLRSYILLGNLDEVKTNLQKLYSRHPPLSVNCRKISWTNSPLEQTSCINGDANNDGKVNLLDFGVWKTEYLANTASKADFNNDGKVNLLDFGVWKIAYLQK